MQKRTFWRHTKPHNNANNTFTAMFRAIVTVAGAYVKNKIKKVFSSKINAKK